LRPPPTGRPVYPRVIDELIPAARHILEQHANNAIEADNGRLKARLRPMRGLKSIRSLHTVAAGHAFVQNLRRGHYEFTPTSPSTIASAPRSLNSNPASNHAHRLTGPPRLSPIDQRNRAVLEGETLQRASAESSRLDDVIRGPRRGISPLTNIWICDIGAIVQRLDTTVEPRGVQRPRRLAMNHARDRMERALTCHVALRIEGEG
jgi:hypothetical protein